MTEPPSQNVVGPSGVTVAAGAALTVTVVGALVVLQVPSLTVTVYSPDAVTVMARVVAPVDQRYEVPSVAVRVTEPPAQNVAGPLAVMAAEGTSGIVAGAEKAPQPSLSVTSIETTTGPVPSGRMTTEWVPEPSSTVALVTNQL